MLLFLLTFLAVIPFLFSRRVRRVVVVPSILYFKLLKRRMLESSAPEKFTWENWLPILILFSLAAALVFQTFRVEGYQRAVIVIDCSASMQWQEGNRSRFEQALELAQETLSREKPDEVMIIAAEKYFS
jgi:hypothetical protein